MTAAAETISETATRERPQAAAKRPRILVTGADELRMRRVVRRLGRLRARVVQLGWEEALDTLKEDVASLVLVDPLPRISAAAAVKTVRGHPDGAAVATFVVVDDGTSSKRVLGLYAAGASAVFEWPGESFVMATLFAESFGIVKVRGRSEAPDQALVRAVRARLRLYPELPGGVRLFTRDGLVSVAGQVPSLVRRQELIDTIAAVPGVRGVIHRSLWVAASRVSDRELYRRLRGLLDVALEGASDLSLEVQSGHVEVSGQARDRADVGLLERLIASVDGVRGLDLRVETASEPPPSDRRIAQRLRRAMTILYPQSYVRIDVVQGTAILSGTVASLLTKYSIERFASRAEGVRRVVDKIAVK